jgi:hypothetical protein
MRCGFGVKSRAKTKKGSSFRLAIFCGDLTIATARLSPQSPVAWPNHRAQLTLDGCGFDVKTCLKRSAWRILGDK